MLFGFIKTCITEKTDVYLFISIDILYVKATGQGLRDKVSGTVPGRSSRSEEELFADAVTEFADAESHHTEEGVVISGKFSRLNYQFFVMYRIVCLEVS